MESARHNFYSNLELVSQGNPIDHIEKFFHNVPFPYAWKCEDLIRAVTKARSNHSRIKTAVENLNVADVIATLMVHRYLAAKHENPTSPYDDAIYEWDCIAVFQKWLKLPTKAQNWNLITLDSMSEDIHREEIEGEELCTDELCIDRSLEHRTKFFH